MSLMGSSFYFILGFIIAFLFPRIPVLFITRGRGFNVNLPPHPEPIPLSPYLTQRILHLRMFYWLGLMVAIIPLSFGLISVRWGNAPFGFGLWLSSGWLILSRIQSFIGGPKPPWTLEMARHLQVITNESKSDNPCCEFSTPEWMMTGVYCSNCRVKLANIPRPDLGRKRSDGFFIGLVRLIASDGNPMFEDTENSEDKKTDEKNYVKEITQSEE